MSWEILEDAGLTENEARVLHSLMRLEEGKASEIAKASNVSRSMVYDVLKGLYSKGLIRKKKGRPTKYIASSPQKTIQRFLDWKEEEYKEEREKILENKDQLKKELISPEKREEKEKPKHILEFVSLGRVSERQTRNLISGSKEKVKIMSKVLEWFDPIKEALEGTDSKILVLLQDPEKMDKHSKDMQKDTIQVLENLGANIRFTDEMPLRGCISGEEAVINVKEKESSNLLRDCVYTNHQSFVRALNLYFDGLWEE